MLITYKYMSTSFSLQQPGPPCYVNNRYYSLGRYLREDNKFSVVALDYSESYRIKDLNARSIIPELIAPGNVLYAYLSDIENSYAYMRDYFRCDELPPDIVLAFVVAVTRASNNVIDSITLLWSR